MEETSLQVHVASLVARGSFVAQNGHLWRPWSCWWEDRPAFAAEKSLSWETEELALDPTSLVPVVGS